MNTEETNKQSEAAGSGEDESLHSHAQRQALIANLQKWASYHRCDPEITAMGTMLYALRPFDYEARCRIIRYLGNWVTDPKNGGLLGDDATKKGNKL